MWQVLFLSFVHLVSADGKCRVLALGGGSDKGAYTAGVVIGLSQHLPAGEGEWDVVTGNGDGAINAFIIAQTSPGQESDAAKALDEFWTQFTWSDFYKDWTGWLITGLFYKSGLYNSVNMRDTIEKLDKGSSFARTMGVGGTDLITGGYVYFDSDKISMTTMKTGVMASASNSGIFPYVQYQDYKLVDGSIKFSVDILHGIDYCNAKGYQDEDIIVYPVLNSGKKLKEIDASGYKTLQVLFRYLAIASYDGTMQVIENAHHDHPKVTIHDPIYPSEGLPDSLYPYDYSSSQLLTMINLGIRDAKAAVSKWF